MKRTLKRICKLPIFILALPGVILIRLLRPFVWIRFHPIHARIGHAVGNVECFLLERKAGMDAARSVDIFFPGYRPGSNRYLVKMWSRVIPVFEPVKWLAWANNKLPGGELHFKDGGKGLDKDIYGLSNDCEALVYFTPEEERQGKDLLNTMGIGSKPFVCFFARDSVYLQQGFPGQDWSYHNYRDMDVDNFSDAVNYLLDRGYYAVRMSRLVGKPFGLLKDGVIDYAVGPWRSDFADLYLMSQCRYFLGQGAGLEAVARLFRKHEVFVNTIPLNVISGWNKRCLMIFKKLWLKQQKRFMTFREIMSCELGTALDGGIYRRWEIEIVDNTPQEIRDAAVEMDERLSGTWQTNEEYEQLQRRFWALYKPDQWNQVYHARVGSKFLIQNRELLEGISS